MLLASAHKKYLAQKVARFGSLGQIPMIQAPFNSSCVALQYETGTKFFHRAVPEIRDIKNLKKSVPPRVVSERFSWKSLSFVGLSLQNESKGPLRRVFVVQNKVSRTETSSYTRMVVFYDRFSEG